MQPIVQIELLRLQLKITETYLIDWESIEDLGVVEVAGCDGRIGRDLLKLSRQISWWFAFNSGDFVELNLSGTSAFDEAEPHRSTDLNPDALPSSWNRLFYVGILPSINS